MIISCISHCGNVITFTKISAINGAKRAFISFVLIDLSTYGFTLSFVVLWVYGMKKGTL